MSERTTPPTTGLTASYGGATVEAARADIKSTSVRLGLDPDTPHGLRKVTHTT
jgi:hypothetical protein